MKSQTVYDPLMVWLDIETTQLEPDEGDILELGITITDLDLKIQAEESWVISFDRVNIANVSDWAIQQHYASGLLPACFKSRVTLNHVNNNAAAWVMQQTHYTRNAIPMCGASIHFDRAWLKVHLPNLEKVFYYGNFDVSTIEKIARWWWPDVLPWEDKGIHRALPDNHDAIEELDYYAAQGVINMRTMQRLAAMAPSVNQTRENLDLPPVFGGDAPLPHSMPPI